jgi:type I restriction enzyme M protein
MRNESIIQKIWSLCNILRGDGISYHEYISELTYLLFLKIAKENETEHLLPANCRWERLTNYKGEDLLTEYRDMLTYLGGHAPNEIVRKIYAFPTTVFSHSENLRAVIDGVNKLDWHSINKDGIGDIYEGLLAKNSQDSRSGAGQYFTPRPLVDCIIKLAKPYLGEVIQDPAVGSGGFLISADQYIRNNNSLKEYKANPPQYEGVEIEKGTYRICLMNAFLHQMNARLIFGDALTKDADDLTAPDLILANPPFGAKAGSVRKKRSDIDQTANKQLAFLQHIYSVLRPGGRAAVVMPDNVLFEEGIGKKIRRELMDKCNLHTILRLPVGIFYSQGVKTNVLFFQRGYKDQKNTESVWIYDMRAGITKFGKKRPLTNSDFLHFEKAFGNEPSGLSKRLEEGETGRWRSFSREQIENRNDNLDIGWLENSEADLDEALSEPADIAVVIMNHLKEALNEIRGLSEEIEIDTTQQEAL